MGETAQLYIGLMSGTSMDGIDAVLVSFEQDHCTLIEAIEYKIPEQLRLEIMALSQPGDNEIDRLGTTDRQLAIVFAEACNALIEKTGANKTQVAAIGSHGQTIRHRPDNNTAFTLQIGDPNTIAHLTGITTVADFRRRDIAAGGQGAPLAPAFHQAMFSHQSHKRAIINIGGMANISLLENNTVNGYDTGPGNVLMDSWIQHKLNQTYDRDGAWAASGKVIKDLLDEMLQHEYFARPAPKSTGRETFNLQWLHSLLNTDYPAEDVQATLLEFSARSIIGELDKLDQDFNELYICGGGAYNKQLMLRLETLAHPRLVASTDTLGIAPEWVEAAAFAWLAKQALEQTAIKVSNITGASKNIILGGIYPA